MLQTLIRRTVMEAVREAMGRPLPRLLGRGKAAAYVGVSEGTFKFLAARGDIARGRKIPSESAVVRSYRLMWRRDDLDR